jgi:hypothetical protein
MKQSKTPFEIVNFNFEVIMNLSPDPYDFCEMWKNYLAGCGWTEEEYQKHLEDEVFKVED